MNDGECFVLIMRVLLQKLFNVCDVNDAMFVSFLNVRIVVETNCDVKDNVRVDDVIKSVSVNIHQVSIHDANVRPSNLVSVNVYRVSLHPKMSSTVQCTSTLFSSPCPSTSVFRFST